MRLEANLIEVRIQQFNICYCSPEIYIYNRNNNNNKRKGISSEKSMLYAIYNKYMYLDIYKK